MSITNIGLLIFFACYSLAYFVGGGVFDIGMLIGAVVATVGLALQK